MFNCRLLLLNAWKHNGPPNPYTYQTTMYLEQTVLQISIKSKLIQSLRKDVNMITILGIFISSSLTTSSFKTFMWTHNLIRTLRSILDPNFSMKTYQTIPDTICPFISKHFLHSAFLFILPNSENVSLVKIPHHTMIITLTTTCKPCSTINKITWKCNSSHGPDIYDSQAY